MSIIVQSAGPPWSSGFSRCMQDRKPAKAGTPARLLAAAVLHAAVRRKVARRAGRRAPNGPGDADDAVPFGAPLRREVALPNCQTRGRQSLLPANCSRPTSENWTVAGW